MKYTTRRFESGWKVGYKLEPMTWLWFKKEFNTKREAEQYKKQHEL